jgi:hypothetical protein
MWSHSDCIRARSHDLDVWDPIDLVQSLAHSLEIRPLSKLGHPMWDCVAEALLGNIWLVRRDGPNGGNG